MTRTDKNFIDRLYLQFKPHERQKFRLTDTEPTPDADTAQIHFIDFHDAPRGGLIGSLNGAGMYFGDRDEIIENIKGTILNRFRLTQTGVRAARERPAHSPNGITAFKESAQRLEAAAKDFEQHLNKHLKTLKNFENEQN